MDDTPNINQTASQSDDMPPATAAAPATGTPPPAAGARPAPAAAPAPAVAPSTGGTFQHIYHNIMDVMGGKVDHHYTVDAKTGKMQDNPTPRTPGSQWAHLVTAAMAGLASSEGVRGPQAGLVALGKGAGAGVRTTQAEDERSRQKAQQDFQRGQQADELTMRKARDAREQQESILKAQEYSNKFKQFNYEFEHLKEHDQQELADRWNARATAGVQPLRIEGKEVPEFDTLKEANDFAQDPKNTKGMLGGFQTRIDIDPATHKFVVGQVPQDKKQWEVDLGNGQKGYFFGTANDYLGFQNKQAELRHNKELIKEADLRIAGLSIDLKDKQKLDHASTSWRKALQASGNDTQKAVQYLRQKYPEDASFLQDRELDMISTKGGIPIFSDAFPEQKDPFGEAMPMKAPKVFEKEMAAFQKEYVLPANSIEKSYQMSDLAYQEYMKARAQGKELSSGAQSMIMLSNHLNTTFGVVKGARITKDMIHEHLGARSISDDVLVAFQKLNNGDALSYSQWQAFHDLIVQSRNTTWKLAADNALNQKLPRSFLPRGDGKFIDDDPNTAQLFYDIAGSAQKAQQAALQFGWRVREKP